MVLVGFVIGAICAFVGIKVYTDIFGDSNKNLIIGYLLSIPISLLLVYLIELMIKGV